MPKPYISFYLPNLDGGGAERVMLNLANGIAEREDITVDFIVAEKKGPLLPDISEKLNLVDLGASRIATSLLPLTNYLRTNRPDALVSALNTANVIAVIAKKLSRTDTKLFVTEHNTLSVTAGNPNSLRARLVPWLVARAYPHADGIVAVSKGVADDLSEFTGLARHTIEVIYNPVITPQVRNLCKAPCTDEWINDERTPVLLGIGRLSPQKDFANLLTAMAIVTAQRPAKLIILGEGSLRTELETMVNNLGLSDTVKMPGFVKNPYSYLANAKVFVLSSQWEGLPTVLIEALYCGTRLVSTDCPSGPSEILDNGKFGLLVKTQDADELASGILAALENSTDTFPPKTSWAHYTLEHSIEHYLTYVLDRKTSTKSTGNQTHE